MLYNVIRMYIKKTLATNIRFLTFIGIITSAIHPYTFNCFLSRYNIIMGHRNKLTMEQCDNHNDYNIIIDLCQIFRIVDLL